MNLSRKSHNGERKSDQQENNDRIIAGSLKIGLVVSLGLNDYNNDNLNKIKTNTIEQVKQTHLETLKSTESEITLSENVLGRGKAVSAVTQAA
jgi:hypothetical protein